MERYFGAVYRYLLAVLKNEADAEDLAQEFALRFLRGDFRRASPDAGRFRDYVKTSLRNMLNDHFRGKKNDAKSLDIISRLADPKDTDLDAQFRSRWRDELLEWTWEELREWEANRKTPYYTVLRWRAEHPKQRVAVFADELSVSQGRSYSESSVRQILHRARDCFAELLRSEVARSLQTEAQDQLEEELAELNLLQYCKRSTTSMRDLGS